MHAIPTKRLLVYVVAGLVVRGMIDDGEAEEMAHDLAYGLAKKAYKL